MPDRALHHDIDTLHGDAAARGGIAVDAQQAAASRGACRLARIARYVNEARQHVLGHARTGATVDQYGGELVHAGAVIANRAIDLDHNWRIEPRGDGVTTSWVIDDPVPLISVRPEIMQRGVERAERRGAEIELGHCLAFPKIDRGWLGLPYARRLDAGEVGERPILRAECDVAIGLGHDRWLAGNAVAEHAEAVLGADHEGIKAVEVVEAHFERIAERKPLAHLPAEIARRDLSVVLGFEVEALAP